MTQWPHSRPAVVTAAHHYAQLLFVYLVKTGFHHVGQAGLGLLTSSDPPVSAFQSAGMTGWAWGGGVCVEPPQATVATLWNPMLNLKLCPRTPCPSPATWAGCKAAQLGRVSSPRAEPGRDGQGRHWRRCPVCCVYPLGPGPYLRFPFTSGTARLMPMGRVCGVWTLQLSPQRHAHGPLVLQPGPTPHLLLLQARLQQARDSPATGSEPHTHSQGTDRGLGLRDWCPCSAPHAVRTGTLQSSLLGLEANAKQRPGQELHPGCQGLHGSTPKTCCLGASSDWHRRLTEHETIQFFSKLHPPPPALATAGKGVCGLRGVCGRSHRCWLPVGPESCKPESRQAGLLPPGPLSLAGRHLLPGPHVVCVLICSYISQMGPGTSLVTYFNIITSVEAVCKHSPTEVLGAGSQHRNLGRHDSAQNTGTPARASLEWHLDPHSSGNIASLITLEGAVLPQDSVTLEDGHGASEGAEADLRPTPIADFPLEVPHTSGGPSVMSGSSLVAVPPSPFWEPCDGFAPTTIAAAQPALRSSLHGTEMPTPLSHVRHLASSTPGSSHPPDMREPGSLAMSWASEVPPGGPVPLHVLTTRGRECPDVAGRVRAGCTRIVPSQSPRAPASPIPASSQCPPPPAPASPTSTRFRRPSP
ncbi:hypothetical protein AAY473_015937 [Plecturocebus cupreus]